MEVTTLSCPACNATLRTNAAALGKRVKCPKCEQIFTAPAEPGGTAIRTSAPTPPPLPGSPKARSGERVFARWNDGFWYPATVQSRDTQSVRLVYDDGTTGLVEPEHVEPLNLDVDDRVFVRYQGGPDYYPGKITRISGETIHVHFDDGDQEASTAAMVRVVRGKLPWKIGDRVLAQWHGEPYLYPARITDITDGAFLSVTYDDGDRADLLPVQVQALDLHEGDRVFSRWKQGQEYFPGRIMEMQGNKIQVDYDDGDSEWTTISVVRVLPEDLARRERA